MTYITNIECTPMVGSGQIIGDSVPQAPDRYEISFPRKSLGSFIVRTTEGKTPEEVLVEALKQHDGFDIPNICDRNPQTATDFSGHLGIMVDPQATTNADLIPESRSQALDFIFQRELTVIFSPPQSA